MVEIELKDVPSTTVLAIVGQQSANLPTIENHIVARFTLKSGEHFAIDFAGSQHGLVETLVPWDEYISQYCRRIVSITDLSDLRKDFPQRCQPSLSSMLTMRAKLIMSFVEAHQVEYLLRHPYPIAKMHTKNYRADLDSWLDGYMVKMATIVPSTIAMIDPLCRLPASQKPSINDPRLGPWRILQGLAPPESLAFALCASEQG